MARLIDSDPSLLSKAPKEAFIAAKLNSIAHRSNVRLLREMMLCVGNIPGNEVS